MDAIENQSSPYRTRSAWIPILMSGAAIALLAGYFVTGPHEPNMVVENGVAREDEGAAAHLWQLLMVLQLPVIGWFALRWLPRAPQKAIAVLALQALAIVMAALPVYILEM